MAGKGKPGPAPRGERLKKSGVALRPDDMGILQQLSLERFLLEMGKLDPFEAHRAIFERGARPSASWGIRYLIDQERDRRIAKAEESWRNAHPGKPAPSPEELLAGDFVFGSATITGRATVQASGTVLSGGKKRR